MPSNQGLEGLGFVRDGFRGLLQVPAQDLRIGARFWGDHAQAVTQAIGHAARTMARMPAYYTTYADGRQIFPMDELHRRDRLVDASTLAGAHDRIVDWWLKGYRKANAGPVAERFVREAVATLALAQPRSDQQLLDDVFTGVEYQRMRLRHDQRLEEWRGIEVDVST